jgi:hypothetical protein
VEDPASAPAGRPSRNAGRPLLHAQQLRPRGRAWGEGLDPGTALLTALAAAGALRAGPLLTAAQKTALAVPLVTFPLVYSVIGCEAR